LQNATATARAYPPIAGAKEISTGIGFPTKFPASATSGVIKDVVMVGGFQEVEIDFVADNPGLTLFHCHQQLPMDFGFMSLFEYV
jgi:FtsP/CotA-like multicopper oxidase with cupredoxin domain